MAAKRTSRQIYEALMTSTDWLLPLIKAAATVYQTLGHGRSEKNYQAALSIELSEHKILHQREYPLTFYLGEKKVSERTVGTGIPDFLILDRGVVELKTVTGELSDDHVRQLHTYLLATDYRCGVCINFPKAYAETIGLVILCLDPLKTTLETEEAPPKEAPRSETMETREEALAKDRQWYRFDLRLKAVPHKCHKIQKTALIDVVLK